MLSLQRYFRKIVIPIFLIFLCESSFARPFQIFGEESIKEQFFKILLKQVFFKNTFRTSFLSLFLISKYFHLRDAKFKQGIFV